MIDELEDVRDHLNADHADTVALVARFLTADRLDNDPTADRATVLAAISRAGADGVDLTVRIGETSTEPLDVRHAFATPCSSIDEVRIEFFGLLNAAREWAGDTVPLTSLERELVGVEYTTFISEVVAVTDITPTLRQITFGGGLDDFESLGADQFLYVLLPPRGGTELTVDANFSWLGFDEMPEDQRPAGAYYTVRAWRPVERELDMWFVLHGDAGASSAWASRVEPGQPAALWGPRRAFDPPENTGSYLLVTDETGFGAVCAVLDDVLAADPLASVTVVAEADGAVHRIDFPAGPNVTVRWVDREGEAPGTTSVLLDAVRDIDVAAGPDIYAFGAGESRRITAVRKHLRDTCGLAAEQVSMTGYWRAT